MADKSVSSTDQQPLPMRMPLDNGPIDYRRFADNVETKSFPSGIIEQTIDIAGSHTRRVMDTAEQHIRDALIALGWTPPPDPPRRPTQPDYDRLGLSDPEGRN